MSVCVCVCVCVSPGGVFGCITNIYSNKFYLLIIVILLGVVGGLVAEN